MHFSTSNYLVALVSLPILAVQARTDLSGCVSSTAGPSLIWYVPGTGELCEFVDCGGGTAPPKSSPGCPLYSGTETVTPSFLPGFGSNTAAATMTTLALTGPIGSSTFVPTVTTSDQTASANPTDTSSGMVTGSPSTTASSATDTAAAASSSASSSASGSASSSSSSSSAAAAGSSASSSMSGKLTTSVSQSVITTNTVITSVSGSSTIVTTSQKLSTTSTSVVATIAAGSAGNTVVPKTFVAQLAGLMGLGAVLGLM